MRRLEGEKAIVISRKMRDDKKPKKDNEDAIERKRMWIACIRKSSRRGISEGKRKDGQVRVPVARSHADRKIDVYARDDRKNAVCTVVRRYSDSFYLIALNIDTTDTIQKKIKRNHKA